MPPARGPLWEYFHQGARRNTSHYNAYCWGCLSHYSKGKVTTTSDTGSDDFKAAMDATGGVLGERKAMVAHLAGSRPCQYASAAAKQAAHTLAATKAGAKKKRLENASSAQSQLNVDEGLDTPFSTDEIIYVRQQFLRATISANLPSSWVDNPEVRILFEMFRSTATQVIPSRRCLRNGRQLRSQTADTREATPNRVDLIKEVEEPLLGELDAS
ncbi:hypothetical protein ONZ45_g11006 [Pleurotus djamor]|nr:hypothetical protein ONZ45_g11006 [Pleurotus djamor]